GYPLRNSLEQIVWLSPPAHAPAARAASRRARGDSPHGAGADQRPADAAGRMKPPQRTGGVDGARARDAGVTPAREVGPRSARGQRPFRSGIHPLIAIFGVRRICWEVTLPGTRINLWSAALRRRNNIVLAGLGITTLDNILPGIVGVMGL